MEVTIQSPQDVVAFVPHGIGFYPVDSLCMVKLGISPGSPALAYRFDLPALDDIDSLADQILTFASGPQHVFLVGYGTAEQVTPLIQEVLRQFAVVNVVVLDALRVTGDRFWSYMCPDSACCPAEGTTFDATSGPVAAQVAAAGLVTFGSRDDLAATIAPLTGEARQRITKATHAAIDDLLAHTETHEFVFDQMITTGETFVADLAARLDRGNTALTDEEIAWLGLLLQNLQVRNRAWILITPADPQPHIAFWTDVVRRVDPSQAAAPAFLLAYAASLAGEGALTNIALDRAKSADPQYKMAVRLRVVINSGLMHDQVTDMIAPDILGELS